MSKNVVESSEDKGQEYNFLDYAYSKKVVADFPRIISLYEKFLPVLYQNAEYRGVWQVIQSIEDAKMYMEFQYQIYKEIYDRKGKTKRE